MNMKQKAGPAIVVAAVVVALLIVYGIYKLSFTPQNPPATRDYMPEYAKQRAVKPGEEGAAGGQPRATPGYGQAPGSSPYGAPGGPPGNH